MRIPAIRRFAALLLIGALVAGCQSMQDMIGNAPKPSAHVVGVSIRGLSLQSIVLLFDIEVENPYAVALPLADLGYALTSNGKNFLEGSLKPTGTIPAHGKQVLQVPATVQFSSMASVLKGVKPGAVVPYTANFKIGVDTPVVGHVDVPLSKSGELPVPAVPRVEMESFAVEKLGVDQIKATAKLQIHNNNEFPLDLKRFGANFALAGVDIGGGRVGGPITLPAGKDVAINIPLSMSPRAVGMSLVNFLRGKEIAYNVSGAFDADTQFGPLSLPFNHTGNTAVTR
ncbi:MAG: LEA type 2 family protein [Betaproteobacteria bacterium]